MYVYLHFLVQQSNPMWLIAFASIRVYAIDSRRWMRAAIVMMLGLMPVVINIVSIYFTVDIISLIHASFTVWCI